MAGIVTFSSSSSHAHFTLLVFDLVNLCHTLAVTESASVPLPPPIAFLESEVAVTPGIPFRPVIDGRFARRARFLSGPPSALIGSSSALLLLSCSSLLILLATCSLKNRFEPAQTCF